VRRQSVLQDLELYVQCNTQITEMEIEQENGNGMEEM
jgi:hypothetical protein